MTTLKLRSERKDDQVEVEVFAGPEDGNLGHCGTLTMRPDEYHVLVAVLLAGVRGAATDRVLVEVSG